jgi:succinyl-CoA synthetase alpha subunit
MAITKVEIRQGIYYDSLILMELQVGLTALPGIKNAGAMMGLLTNKDVLKQSGLLTPEAEKAQADDLIISVEGEDDAVVDAALAKIDELLTRKRDGVQQGYRPKSLATAVGILPEAGWVSISVPGEYAAGVAREALRLKKSVFLYSDNVTVEDEIALKREAAGQGLLLMGPDCGTAIINGVGLGFSNQVRRGPIGLVGASGTGLQQVTSQIHALGSGITHALGTGGRDLSHEVGGLTTLQGLELLEHDEDTKIIVLISKPPAPEVATKLLQVSRLYKKPIVINFIGHQGLGADPESNVHFASTLDEAAKIAVDLVSEETPSPAEQKENDSLAEAANSRYLRGLYSGGTLAYEAQLILQNYLPAVYSNTPLKKEYRLDNPQASQEHTILDLGEDEFTVGRPHPMLDQSLRLERFAHEAADPEVAIILVDVVLGHGAHHDPAGELAPAITDAKKTNREVEIVAVVVGTDEDPQDYQAQIDQLKASGARVETSNQAAAQYVGERLQVAIPKNDFPAIDPAILKQSTSVINIGLESFAESALSQGAQAVHVDCRPPAGGNTTTRLMEAKAVLVGLGKARDVIPGMNEDLLLHAGPPIDWGRASGPMRGAITGALIFEGKAKNEREAQALVENGEVRLEPCHHHQTVGPMAGVTSASMSVYIIENATHGNRAFSNLNEGYGKVLRYGAFDEEVQDRLRWMEEEMAPILRDAIDASGGLDIKAVLSEALHMGDEGHNRNKAGSILFLKALAPLVAEVSRDNKLAAQILKTIGDNALSVLNPVMAACKVMADAAHGIEGSTIVSTMARNGTDFGIRVSGLGDRWFTAPSQIPKGLYFPGYSDQDANSDIGDSTITETAGIGGFAMAAAPAIVTFVSGKPQDAVNATMEMYEITHSEHKHFTIPSLDFRGTPTGIDLRKVVELGVTPRVNTGIAHKEAGIGQIGAGLVRPPLAVFEEALVAFAEHYDI